MAWTICSPRAPKRMACGSRSTHSMARPGSLPIMSVKAARMTWPLTKSFSCLRMAFRTGVFLVGSEVDQAATCCLIFAIAAEIAVVVDWTLNLLVAAVVSASSILPHSARIWRPAVPMLLGGAAWVGLGGRGSGAAGVLVPPFPACCGPAEEADEPLPPFPACCGSDDADEPLPPFPPCSSVCQIEGVQSTCVG